MDEHKHEFAPDEKLIEKVLKLSCPSCGSQLTYSAEKQMIACGHCGFSKDYEKANDMISENSLADAQQLMAKYTPASISKKVVECNGCGSQLMIGEDEVAVRCNFCGSEKVNETAFDKNLIQPQGIIPFKIPKKESKDKFQVWIKKGWFHPNKLKKLAELGDIHGIYVPFWTYDAQTHSQWSGQAGYYYYETESYTDSNGNRQTRQVRKTRWVSRSGSFSHSFDDVLVVASKGLPHNIITKIYPYQLGDLVNYDAQVLVGWESEIYSIDVNEGYGIADGIMDSRLRDIASKDLGGDTQRFLRVSSSKWDQTFKHIILPVWLCTYLYNGKAYQFAVNGQTGKINGEKPLSWVKITLLILVIIAIIATIVIIANQN